LLCLPNLLLRTNKNNKVDFIIYSQGRTGSTLLVDLFNSHPSVYCDREVFFLKTLFPHLFLKAKSLVYRKRNYGCKIQGRQLQLQVGGYSAKPFMEKLNNSGWKIIYLKRRNLLRHAMSRIIYRQIGTSNRHLYKKDSPLNINKFNIDVDELFVNIDKIQKTNKFDEEVLRDIPKLTLTYEDDLLKPETHQDTMDRIFYYLGLQSCSVNSDLVRITSNEFRDFISNYDEFESRIVNSPYSMYL